MHISMEKQEVLDALNAGHSVVLATDYVSDLETPVGAFLKLCSDERNSFLLESVKDGSVRGRYSIIGFDPDVIWQVKGSAISVSGDGLTPEMTARLTSQTPLESLRQFLEYSQLELPENLPPMSAGVFGYLGYDMIRWFEHLPCEKPDALHTPDALLIRPQVLAIFDNVRDRFTIITPVRPKNGSSVRTLYESACARLEKVLLRITDPLPRAQKKMTDLKPISNPFSNTQEAEYLKMVGRAKEYILEGDIFQVVLSQRFETEFALSPLSLYRALRRTNPSPYMYFLNFEEFAVVGSSPEILVRVNNGEVTIRPIAGTYPRGQNAAEDKQLSQSLLADPKERAEHLMLLDLGRNDVGRTAEYGSVKVTDSFFTEYYSHVMHIVSNVVGKLKENYGALDAVMAGFPAGTVSGAPKIRAMQIIDELEKDKRGIYGGCVGYFSADGNMDTCIVLRTAIVKDGKIYVQAGAGIVADSIDTSELRECIQKSRALFSAAEEAVRIEELGDMLQQIEQQKEPPE